MRDCPAGPEPEEGFTTRPNICVQSDQITMTHDLAPEGESIIGSLLVRASVFEGEFRDGGFVQLSFAEGNQLLVLIVGRLG